MIAAYVFVVAATVFSGRENQLRVPAPRVDAAAAASMTIDGALDDEVWQSAAVLTGFSQYSPVDGRPAENTTEVLVFSSPTTNTSRPEVGTNVRWGVTPNLTMNGTINPDFSQVEADAGQFTFDPRNAIFFPEKRPFFLDGAELFNAPNNLIYTRRIVAPEAAVKLTGKAAGTDLAILSAIDDRATSTALERPIYNIVRLHHDLPRSSKVGLVCTDRIEGPASNRVFAGDTRLLFGSIYNLQLQAGGSRTANGDTAITAPIWQAIFNRDGRHFGFRYQANGIHEDFQAASGFISRSGIITSNLTS